MDNIFLYIEKHLDEWISNLRDFIGIPSITNDKNKVEECAEYLSDMLTKSGIKSKVIATEGNPVVYGEVLNVDAMKTLIIYGHYDVQPIEPLSEWKSKPFDMVIRNKKIYGRGVADDKGQIFANIKGVEALLNKEDKLPINIKFIFEGEEETGSNHLEQFLIEHKNLLDGDLLIGCDTHIYKSGLPIIYLGNKGNLSLQLSVKAAPSEGHSQNSPIMINAAWILIDILKSLKNNKGEIIIKGFYDNIKPLLPEEIEAVKKIPLERSLITEITNGSKRLLPGINENNYYYNLIFEPSSNIIGISTGYTGEGIKAIIPSSANVKMNFYLVPDQDPLDIVEKLKTHIREIGYLDEVEIDVFSATRGSRLPITNPYVPILSKAIKDIWKMEPLIIPNCPGSNPGYLFQKHLGLNFVLIPLALYDENAHAPNENIPIDSLIKGMKFTANLIRTLD